MISNRPDGYKPVFNALDTEEKESLWIADTILDNVAKNMKYSDHTILVRAASQTRSLEEAFIKRKVPYKNGAFIHENGVQPYGHGFAVYYIQTEKGLW